MDIAQNRLAAAARPRLVGRFVASQVLLWMFAALLLGAAVARLAGVGAELLARRS